MIFAPWFGLELAAMHLLIMVALLSTGQSVTRAPLTIEARQNVWVTHNGAPSERRGALFLANSKAKGFRLRKGQRFVMVSDKGEGECRIRFRSQEYDLTSCPWLSGFQDHQADVFRVIEAK